MNRWDEYIQWSKDNPKKVCDKVKKAIQRFELMYKDTTKKGSKIYFDEEEPNLIIQFAEEYLQLMTDDGLKPIVVYPWQAFILAGIYGFKYKSDKTRVVRTAVVSTAKKQGKSTFEAIPILYDLFSRPGARIYLAALNKDQTRNVFDPIQTMLENSKELLSYVEISKKQKSVVKMDTAGAINTLSKGAETKQGIKPSLAVVDEYYLYKNDDLLSIIKYGFRSVKNPLLFIITTNGKDKNSPYYQEYERCSKILDGIIDDESTFCIFYELDKTDRWDVKSNLVKANPMLNHGLSFEKDYKSDLEEAKNKPFKQSDYKMLTCNIWVDSTIDTWIPDSKWLPCLNKPIPKDEELLECPSALGVDLSQVSDFTVLTQYFKLQNELYYAKHYFYIPEEEIQKKIDENINIKNWIEEGYITPTPGGTIDYSYLSNKVKELASTFNVLALGYDRYKFETIKNNFEDINLIDFNQNISNFSEPTKRWEAIVTDKKLIDPNPVMRWMVSCAVVKPDVNGNYKPLKPDYKKTHKRIDGVITSIMAYDILSSMAKNQTPKYSIEDIRKLLG